MSKLSIRRGGRKLPLMFRQLIRWQERWEEFSGWMCPVTARSKSCPKIICSDQEVPVFPNMIARCQASKSIFERTLYSFRAVDLLQHIDASARAEDSVFHKKVKLLSTFTQSNTSSSFCIGKMQGSMQLWDFVVEKNLQMQAWWWPRRHTFYSL